MRKKFILHLRTPKGDRRLEQVALSTRDALQRALEAVPEHLPPGLPDDARCRLECEGQVLGFCPDELGVLAGAMGSTRDVLDGVDRRRTVVNIAKSDLGDFVRRMIEEAARRTIREALYRRMGFPTTTVGASPGHVHAHAPNVQQPPPDWATGGRVRRKGVVHDLHVGLSDDQSIVEDFGLQVGGLDDGVPPIPDSPFPWVPMADSTAPPPAPSAPASGSTTAAPGKTPGF